MPRWLMFLIFLTFVLGILGGIHFYFYIRLVKAPMLSSTARSVIGWGLLMLAIYFPLSFMAVRTLDLAVARVVLFPIYCWLGIMLLLLFVLLSFDFLRGIFALHQIIPGIEAINLDGATHLFITRVLAASAVGIVAFVSGFALFQGLKSPIVKNISITIPKLPPAFHGFRIVQLTDLHLGAMRGEKWLKKVVAQSNALEPNLVAITGDLADASVSQLAEKVSALADLKATYGVYFVTGNHEYFYDLKAWLNKLAELHIRVLRNESVLIRQDEAVLYLAGVDDQEGKRLSAGHGTNLKKALKDRDQNQTCILLAHQPRTVKQAATHKVDLVLSGHTHGGQLWPWHYFVYLQQPYVRGHHTYKGTQIYISDGAALWGPPMRLGSRSEISLLTLH